VSNCRPQSARSMRARCRRLGWALVLSSSCSTNSRVFK